MLFARTASAAELGLLGTGAAKLPVRVVGVASVPLRGVTFAFAAVSCVVITYELTWACRMDMLTYSADFSLMYIGWACEILVVPAHRQSRAAVAGGTDLWSVVWGSVRLVVSRSLRVAKSSTVVGLLVATMVWAPTSFFIGSWPAENPTWGDILDDAVSSSALLAGPETFFIVPFVLLTLLGASAYILMGRLEVAAESVPSPAAE